MDFPNRSVQTPAPAAAHPAPAAGGKRNKQAFSWGRVGVVLSFGAVAVLLLSVAGLVAFGGPKPEDSYVANNKLQAVFLNTGQVYFGNMKALNSKYLVLKNIYYLQTSNSGSSSSTANANTSVSLVKLGCELHEPLDQMVINRSQVTFWENLGDNGQVAKAVATFEKQNPKGQKCADQSSSAGTNSASTTQNAPTTGNSTNSTTTNP
jgi:hypothetical protein